LKSALKPCNLSPMTWGCNRKFLSQEFPLEKARLRQSSYAKASEDKGFVGLLSSEALAKEKGLMVD
jgi:hypothetical protein